MFYWWKEFLKGWKLHFFVIIEIVFIIWIFFVGFGEGKDVFYALQAVSLEDESLYYYENAAASFQSDASYDGFQRAVRGVERMEGCEEIGYWGYLSCKLPDYKNEKSMMDNTMMLYNYNEYLASALKFRVMEGSWFTDQKDNNGDLIPVIIGGNLCNQYQVGDRLDISIFGEEYEKAIVIGSLGTEYYRMIDSFQTTGRDLTSYLCKYEEDSDIILTCSNLLEEKYQTIMRYPSQSFFLKITNNTDLSSYRNYGVLTPFRQLIINSEQKRNHFILELIAQYGIWLVVIVFSVLGVSYLLIMRNRYMWGIYSLLGMNKGRIKIRLFGQVFLSSILGIIIALCVYPSLSLGYMRGEPIEQVHIWIGMIVMVLVWMICGLCLLFTEHLNPRQLMNVIKE